MPVGHITFDAFTPHGKLLRDNITKLQDSIDKLNDLRESMIQMIDGDGSQAAHFDYFIGKFGFLTNEDAKACFEELASMLFKLNTDAQVSNVQAALNQFFARLS